MEISRQNNTVKPIKETKTPSFKALPISKLKYKNLPIVDEITLFQVGKEDLPFLKKMLEKLNLESLYPHLDDKSFFKEWKDIIEGAIDNLQRSAKGVLATRNKKPCGILTYDELSDFNLNYLYHIASWPTAANEGTKGTGKALMRELLDQTVKTNKEKIFLVEASLKPRNKNCGDFYKEIGFTQNRAALRTEMIQPQNAEKNIFKDAASKIDEIFDYEKISSAKEIDLNHSLNIN